MDATFWVKLRTTKSWFSIRRILDYEQTKRRSSKGTWTRDTRSGWPHHPKMAVLWPLATRMGAFSFGIGRSARVSLSWTPTKKSRLIWTGAQMKRDFWRLVLGTPPFVCGVHNYFNDIKISRLFLAARASLRACLRLSSASEICRFFRPLVSVLSDFTLFFRFCLREFVLWPRLW